MADDKRATAGASISAGERVMVRVSPWMGRYIATLAERERRSVSQMVRVLIEEALNARGYDE